MSIKRSSRSSSSSRRRDEGGTFSFNKKEPEPEKSWEEHMEGQGEEAFKPYSPKACFAPGDLLLHATFGKGVVVGVQDRRIDVLFEQGPKVLAHTPA
jgi:hypothetical protein